MSKAATSAGVLRRPDEPETARRPRATRRPPVPGRRRRVIIFVAVVAVLAVFGWLIWISPVLGVRTIRVEGATVVSASDVRSAANITSGTPLARVDASAIVSREQALPAVAAAKVDRSWPNTVVITVTERVPLATVTVEGAQWVIDKTGKVYLPITLLPGGKAPTGTIALDVSHPGPDDRATKAALAVLQALPASIRSLIASIKAPSSAQVTLILSDGRSIIWGSSDESARKARLVGPLLSQPGTVYDVSVPTAVTIR